MPGAPGIVVEAFAAWAWAGALVELELEWATAVTGAVEAAAGVDHGLTAIGVLAVPLRSNLEVRRWAGSRRRLASATRSVVLIDPLRAKRPRGEPPGAETG